MRPTVLVVYCHSNPHSYTRAVLDAVLAGLATQPCDVELVDLYADGFDPVLIVDAAHRRRDLDKVEATAR
jgi:NAD(P)H dehydrogenase (quinone)